MKNQHLETEPTTVYAPATLLKTEEKTLKSEEQAQGLIYINCSDLFTQFSKESFPAWYKSISLAKGTSGSLTHLIFHLGLPTFPLKLYALLEI